MVRVVLPLKLVSEANLASSRPWRQRHARAKSQREQVRLALSLELSRQRREKQLPLQATITRIAPRFLDSDNLSSSIKHVRDGVADFLGVNDADPRVIWICRQQKWAESGLAGPLHYAVEIRLEEPESWQVEVSRGGVALVPPSLLEALGGAEGVESALHFWRDEGGWRVRGVTI